MSKFSKPSPDKLMGHSEVMDFYDSLPDEFEIVPEGHVCVKWPKGFTREWLLILAERGGVCDRDAVLRALAAIAPERKKRRVNLWERECKDYIERRWVYEGEVWNDKVWRKVAGPIEIDD